MQQEISKYTRHLFSGTALSRISGMIRDMSMAAIFGDHPSIAAFMVAFRFAHFFRRVFGEGPLQSILVPQYQSLCLQSEKTQAPRFFFHVTLLLALILSALVLLTEIIALTPLLGSFSFANNEITRLFCYLLPSLLFICLYGLNTSVLQCQNAFFTSSAAPLVCNLIWIAGVFATKSLEMQKAMAFLSLFTCLGFAAQWFLTFKPTFSLFKEGWSAFSGKLFSLSLEMKTIGKATLFGTVGITATQINSFLDMVFARYTDPKAPVYLWYAIRLNQLPLALIGFACIYSVTPLLAKFIKAGSTHEAQNLFQLGKKRIMLFVIPSTLAILACGFAAVDLLFGRGSFSSAAVTETSLCLMAYGLGLLPTTLCIYLSSVCYAFDDYRSPTLASLISVGCNIAFNALFVFGLHMGAISIALATTLSALINYQVIKSCASKKQGWSKEKSGFFPVLICSTVSLCACFCFDLLYWGGSPLQKLLFIPERQLAGQLFYFASQFSLFTTVFLASLFLIRRELFLEIKQVLFARTRET